MSHLQQFKRYVFIGLLFFVGCAVAPQNPTQAVFAAKQNYAVALTAAVAYRNLPRCGAPKSPTVCSDAKVIDQLQKADIAAIALLDGAETTVRSGGTNADKAILAANQAVSALTTITEMIRR